MAYFDSASGLFRPVPKSARRPLPHGESFVALTDSPHRPIDYQCIRHVSHRSVMNNMTMTITVTLVTKNYPLSWLGVSYH